MVARASANYVRVSRRKVSRYGRAVKSMSYREARAVLNESQARGARVLSRVLQSAFSNLMANNKNIDEDTVAIQQIVVNEGPTMKRWKPRAWGWEDRILKRTGHVSVVVSGEQIKK
jgi:large subunit ribosomal protein L22